MAPPIQMIHIHYRTKGLTLLDSDDKTPLYDAKVNSKSPQMEMTHLSPSPSTQTITTASFKTTSLEVIMTIRNRPIILKRQSLLSRSYTFTSPTTESTLLWEADGALTGDFRLVDTAKGNVLCRYRNRLLSTSEVGSMEIIGEVEDELRDEVVISGLAVLAMVQSFELAFRVLLG